MKLGIDLTSFTGIHFGGKDQVAYNLLKSFHDLGYDKDILCICHEEIKEIVYKISPQYTVVTLKKNKEIYTGSNRLLKSNFIQKYRKREYRKIINEYSIDMLLFMNKCTPRFYLPVVSGFVTHDIQIFEVSSIPLLKKMYTFRECLATKTRIRCDFFFRDYVITISDYDKETALTFFQKYKNKIIRIYNPIQFKELKNKSIEKRYITAINIYWEHKNPITLIDAFAKIANSVDYQLLLVGREPENINDLKHHIQDLGVSDRIHFTGFVDEDELTEIFSKTRVYVNTSLYEGFGMTAVEMMGYGIPTIVANTTASPETTLGLCRYYEPPEDADVLAEVLLQEFENPTSDDKLQEISKKIRDKYNCDKIAQEYWDKLTEIVTHR